MNLNIKFLYAEAFMKQWYACNLDLHDRDELEQEITAFLANLPSNNHGRKFPEAGV